MTNIAKPALILRRFLSVIPLNDVIALHRAESVIANASQNLGLSAQVEANGAAIDISKEIINNLTKYQLKTLMEQIEDDYGES